MAPRFSRPAPFYLAASLALAVTLVVGSVLTTDPSQTADASALMPQTVVARLQAGTNTAYPAVLAADLAAQRAAPDDRALALRTARGLIAFGRDQADSRLVGAAIGILRPFLAPDAAEAPDSAEAPDFAEALYLAATARQYQHDFPGALVLLDQAAAAAPNDVNVLLTRATIHTVQGDYPAARSDCARIKALGQAAVAFLCEATTHVLTAEGPAYRARLAQIVSQPNLLDPALHPWAIGLMAEIALHQGDTAAAIGFLTQVVDLAPGSLRERLMLTDIYLAQGDRDKALAVLNHSPETDGVLIRRLRASPDAANAQGWRASLDRRIALNLALGLTAHAREEALYFLTIAPSPEQALARATLNWSLQREIEDAQLLIRAATAANRPEAAQPVTDWMVAAGVLPPKQGSAEN